MKTHKNIRYPLQIVFLLMAVFILAFYLNCNKERIYLDASLQGFVIDKVTGCKLPGETIYLKELGLYSVSDSTGKYALSNLPPKLYSIQITSGNYINDTIVKLFPGENKILDFIIIKPPFLVISTDKINLSVDSSMIVHITNLGGGNLEWEFINETDFLEITPASGITNSKQDSVVIKGINLQMGNTYIGNVQFSSNDKSVNFHVDFKRLIIGYFTDPRDNKKYKYTQIGNQVWMAENLRATEYPDGTSISYIWSNSGWPNLDYGYCFSNRILDSYYDRTVLYKWYTAVYGQIEGSAANPSVLQGVCPDGWHLPSDAEWFELEQYVDSTINDPNSIGYRGTDGGLKLSAKSFDNGTDEYGFTVLPYGCRNFNGNIYEGGLNEGDVAILWTSTQDTGIWIWRRSILGMMLM